MYIYGFAEEWDWLRLHIQWVNPQLRLTAPKQQSEAESFTATDGLFWVWCSPAPAKGKGLLIRSAKGAS